jgi:hypothetical protein
MHIISKGRIDAVRKYVVLDVRTSCTVFPHVISRDHTDDDHDHVPRDDGREKYRWDSWKSIWTESSVWKVYTAAVRYR